MVKIGEGKDKADNVAFLVKKTDSLDKIDVLSKKQKDYIRDKKDGKREQFLFNELDHLVIVQFVKDEKDDSKRLEACRKAGDKIAAALNAEKQKSLVIEDVDGQKEETLALAEGISLGNYQFLRHKSDAKDKAHTLENLGIRSAKVTNKDFEELNILVSSVYQCRDLVNEPLSHLNAVALSKEFERMAEDAGIKVEVFTRKKIESLKMGGLLAVNKGSVDPPTFTIMEWKPEKSKNKKPVILVGKGVVFDTGGLNLKPGNYMNDMKLDMAGAATMGTAIYAIAKAKLPVHVIALIPATDNRPSGNAYVTGDVITMFDGTKVEVINTDAEGRMILADALSYAKKFDPELVIDAATLTGAASRAIGKYGLVAMEKDAAKQMQKLKKTGDKVYERIAEFPFWDEYGELIKSEVADIKNLGGTDAGMITAGKFLAHFTDYPFIHLDIAGPAFIDKKDGYITGGGTGMGVRLLYYFVKELF